MTVNWAPLIVYENSLIVHTTVLIFVLYSYSLSFCPVKNFYQKWWQFSSRQYTLRLKTPCNNKAKELNNVNNRNKNRVIPNNSENNMLLSPLNHAKQGRWCTRQPTFCKENKSNEIVSQIKLLSRKREVHQCSHRPTSTRGSCRGRETTGPTSATTTVTTCTCTCTSTSSRCH